MNRVIPSAKIRVMRKNRKYRARNRKILNRKRREKYSEKKRLIIKHGTEQEARHYGCLKAWRRVRGVPTDARILPKPGYSGRAQKRRDFTSIRTIKKGYVSFDKWRRTYLRRVAITSSTLRAHRSATRKGQRRRKSGLVNN